VPNTPGKNTKSPEEFTLDGAREWAREPAWIWSPPETAYQYWNGLFIWDWSHTQRRYLYMVDDSVADPLIPDLTEFWANIRYWVNTAWTTLGSGLQQLNVYIETLWNSIVQGMVALGTAIKDEISGLANYIANIVTWITWNLVDDLLNFATVLLSPLTAAWAALVTPLVEWFETIVAAITGFLADPGQWLEDTVATLWTWLKSIKDAIWDSLVEAADIIGAYIGTKFTEFAPLVVEHLRDALVFMWDFMKGAFIFVPEQIMLAVWEATKGPLGQLKDDFVNLIGDAYDDIMRRATQHLPVTPERAAAAAGGMFASAVGFGALAHGMALAVETIPNLKYMGVHYLSAFVARMGSFGAISGATMGVIAALAIREPFSYYMKSILRPTQPREMDLQIMAVKPDIDMETFRQGMKYQGYSDFWIDAFQRTMFHEPRYFELSMLGEDEAATDAWLYTKARRGGYSEADAEVFVSSLIKKVTRDQRKEYYKQAFNAFKEGYISIGTFKGALDYLGIRPEAKELAIQAAKMAYEADLYKELVTTYRRSYASDLITWQELDASLSALGMTEERVDAIVQLEWTKKEPKILKAERKEIEAEWRKIQSGYSRMYIESFRKGLITEGRLATNLIAIGIEKRAAQATARYEAIKLVPKPKPIVIEIPYIPVPPSPPRYED